MHLSHQRMDTECAIGSTGTGHTKCQSIRGTLELQQNQLFTWDWTQQVTRQQA